MDGAPITLLPKELLDEILRYLDEDPLDKSLLVEQPTLNSIISSKYRHPPLKSLSRTCRFFRWTLIPILFKHTIHLVTSDARDAARAVKSCPHWPKKFWEFTNVVETLYLRNVVQTFVLAVKDQGSLDLSEECTATSFECREYENRWKALLYTYCPLVHRVTIVAPPMVLTSVVDLGIQPRAARSVHMPYHILCLSTDGACLWYSPSPPNSASPNAGATPSVSTLHSSLGSQSLLKLVPWTGMLYNEGSFLRAISPDFVPADQYWYFKLAFSLQFRREEKKQSSLPELKEFVYVGLTVDQLRLPSIIQFAALLPNLESFTFRLQSSQPTMSDPEQGSTRIREHRVFEVLQASSPRLMYIMKEKFQLADELEVSSCFDKLNKVLCLNSMEECTFDDEEDLPSGWSWAAPPLNMLIKAEEEEEGEEDEEKEEEEEGGKEERSEAE